MSIEIAFDGRSSWIRLDRERGWAFGVVPRIPYGLPFRYVLTPWREHRKKGLFGCGCEPLSLKTRGSGRSMDHLTLYTQSIDLPDPSNGNRNNSDLSAVRSFSGAVVLAGFP